MGSELTNSYPKLDRAALSIQKLVFEDIFEGDQNKKNMIFNHIISCGYHDRPLWDDVKSYMDYQHLAKLRCLKKIQMNLDFIFNPMTGEKLTLLICEDTAPLVMLFSMEWAFQKDYDESFKIIIDFKNKIQSKKGLYADLTNAEIKEHVCNLQKLATCLVLKRPAL